MDSSEQTEQRKPTEMPLLMPDYGPALNLQKNEDPASFNLEHAPNLQIVESNSNAAITRPDVSIDERFRVKLEPSYEKRPPLIITPSAERFSYNVPEPPKSDDDFQSRLDRVTTYGLDGNGQAKMSIDLRKCHSRAKAGVCFKVGF